MKCIVTGSRGFVGSHLVNQLVAEGHEVLAISSKTKARKEDNPKARYIEVNIINFDEIEKYFEGVEVVFHTAALTGTILCIDDPILCYQVNLMASVNILESARKHGVKRVVLSSSTVVYGAETPYKYSKLAMEDVASVYNSLYKVSNICLRYANIYGKNQDMNRKNLGMFAAFKKSFKESGFMQITGDGEQVRDLVHVSDIVGANILAAKSNCIGNIDICTGRRLSLNYITKELLKIPVKYAEKRPGDVKETIQDPKPAFEKIGWRSKVTLEEGIKEIISEFA